MNATIQPQTDRYWKGHGFSRAMNLAVTPAALAAEVSLTEFQTRPEDLLR